MTQSVSERLKAHLEYLIKEEQWKRDSHAGKALEATIREIESVAKEIRRVQHAAIVRDRASELADRLAKEEK